MLFTIFNMRFFCRLAKLQQILFHLSQITPRRPTIRLREQKTQKKTHNVTTQQNELTSISTTELNKLCSDSLTEVLRNFQLSPNASVLELPLNVIATQKWSSKQFNRPSQRFNSMEAKLKSSYVSGASFADNKAEPMISDVRPVAHRNHFLLVSNFVDQLSQPQFVR